jgi:membrane associated rhomboid family serine protease
MEAIMSYRFDRNFNPYYGGSRAPTVKALIIANVVVFVLQIIADLATRPRLGIDPFTYFFGLTPELITSKFYLWQFVTTMFLHGDPIHLLFNMLGLYFFGRDLEGIWGRRKFLYFYFGAGILASLFVYVLNIHALIPTIGASGAVLALLGAYAALYPNREVILYMFPVKVKWIAVGYFVLSIYNMLMSTGTGVSHAAHLAGIVIGVGYIKLKWRAFDNLFFDLKERLRLWRLRRKYRNFKVVDGDVKKMWDDLEDRINRDGRNTHIN